MGRGCRERPERPGCRTGRGWPERLGPQGCRERLEPGWPELGWPERLEPGWLERLELEWPERLELEWPERLGPGCRERAVRRRRARDSRYPARPGLRRSLIQQDGPARAVRMKITASSAASAAARAR